VEKFGKPHTVFCMNPTVGLQIQKELGKCWNGWPYLNESLQSSVDFHLLIWRM